jgi:cytochrome c oxidase assembly factor CtaG
MATSASSRTSATSSVNRLVAYVLGAVFLLIGVLGFAVTTDVGFASREGDTLLGFEVNPLHNIVHLLVGAVLLLGATRGVAAARSANIAIGGTYLVVGLIGLFILDSSANILALNSADNVLHLVSAAALLGAGLATDKDNRRR